MNVQELIDELNLIHDKEMQVEIFKNEQSESLPILSLFWDSKSVVIFSE